MELFIKGIRVRIPGWEQFYPRLSCKFITHQEGFACATLAESAPSNSVKGESCLQSQNARIPRWRSSVGGRVPQVTCNRERLPCRFVAALAAVSTRATQHAKVLPCMEEDTQSGSFKTAMGHPKAVRVQGPSAQHRCSNMSRWRWESHKQDP